MPRRIVIAITRPEKQGLETARLILEAGGEPFLAPTVEITLEPDMEMMRRFIDEALDEHISTVIFMSRNAVKSMIKYLSEHGLKEKVIEKLNRMNVIAIGSKTKAELEENGIETDLIPATYSSEGILEEIGSTDFRRGKVAVLCSNISSGKVVNFLKENGIDVLKVIAYKNRPPRDLSRIRDLLDALSNGKIDVITFTSPSAAVNLFRVASKYLKIEDFRRILKRTVIAAIGPVTERTLRDLGVEVDIVPERYTVEAMINSIKRYMKLGET